MDTESSLQHSQVPATCLYPELAQSNPHSHIPLPEDILDEEQASSGPPDL
jgi:hypothetical protein